MSVHSANRWRVVGAGGAELLAAVALLLGLPAVLPIIPVAEVRGGRRAG